MGRKGFTKKQIQKMKEAIIRCLEKGQTISHACSHLKIDRKTVYRWQANDLVFKQGVRNAKYFIESLKDDIADAGHIKLMQDGEWPAIKYQLDTRVSNKMSKCTNTDNAGWEESVIDANKDYFGKNKP